jgi:hypothetical protein
MKNFTKDELPHLIIGIDTGASSIKIVGSLAGSRECCPLTLDPYCLELDELPLLNAQFDENSTWVGIGGVNYAIGNLAIAKYNCPLEIRPLKIKAVVPKICAAIAVFHQRFKLPSRFALSISSVLPPGEYMYADDMRSALSVAFRRIVTPAGAIKPVVRSLNIYPEGFGVMNWHRIHGIAQTRDIGMLMFGFRNTSVLFSSKGELTKPNSSRYGFHDVLERISATSGGSYPVAELIVPVWKYLIDKDESGFKQVALTDFEMEMIKIRPAIDKAMAEYRKGLEVWLEGVMQQTEVIVLCGGNTEYIGDALTPLLQKYVPKNLAIGDHPILRHIPPEAIPAEIVATGMPNRFLDIYCLWSELNNKVEV